MTHTPGPWKAANEESGDFTIALVGSSWGIKTKHEPAAPEHDARLIAAAPEMLEALEPFARYPIDESRSDESMIVGVCTSGGDAEITVGDIRRAAAVFAKAKGA